MAEPQNEPITVPTSITLGDQTYSVNDTPVLQDLVHKAIIKAQSTEKNKLYPQLQELRNKITELESGRSRVPGTPLTDPEDRIRNEEFRQFMAKMNDNSPQITKEDIQAMIADTFKSQLGELLNQTIAPIQNELASTKKEQVKLYRDRRIAELGDTVIPELVTGETTEEIEAAIILSQGVASRVKGVAPPAPGTPPAPATPPAMFTPGTPPAVTPPAPSGPHMTPDAVTPNIKRMTAEEFAAQRNELQKSIRQFATEYPQMNMEPTQA